MLGMMGRLYRRSLQGGDRVKTRRIWRLLDLDRTNIVNVQITKWNKFDTSQSRETQVCGFIGGSETLIVRVPVERVAEA